MNYTQGNVAHTTDNHIEYSQQTEKYAKPSVTYVANSIHYPLF